MHLCMYHRAGANIREVGSDIKYEERYWFSKFTRVIRMHDSLKFAHVFF